MLLLLMLVWSCRDKSSVSPSLFILMDENHTNISFVNNVEYTEEFNTYTYRNFYNGAGVGIGDINNDGLPDIYFCSNQAGNKLYLNKGNFLFEDITDKAGVGCKGAWSTGVSMADVDGDGWLDIFVCK
jgi:enediyne biosynthesis protein E4